MASHAGPRYYLQIGDTYLPPPAHARLPAVLQQLQASPHVATTYMYGNPMGNPALRAAIVAKIEQTNGIAITGDQVQITSGATHGLACAMQAVANPGDEMLVLTPHWPLVSLIARSHGIVPVEVSIAAECDTLLARLAAACTTQTTALYLSNPNNPCGTVYDPATLAAIATFAAARGLWILADEVYEDYVYQGAHQSIAALPIAGPRTISVYSLSKSFGLAGLRVGYCVAPAAVIAAMRKLVNYSVYNVPEVLQLAALGALREATTFRRDARDCYLAARDAVRAALRVPCHAPAGGAYLFLHIGAVVGQGQGPAFLTKLAQHGVLLAPGAAFGAGFEDWARLCFTALPLPQLLEAVACINALLPAG